MRTLRTRDLTAMMPCLVLCVLNGGGGKDELEREPTCPDAVLRVESTPRV